MIPAANPIDLNGLNFDDDASSGVIQNFEADENSDTWREVDGDHPTNSTAPSPIPTDLNNSQEFGSIWQDSPGEQPTNPTAPYPTPTDLNNSQEFDSDLSFLSAGGNLLFKRSGTHHSETDINKDTNALMDELDSLMEKK